MINYEGINKKWQEITKNGFLCYENNLELANEIIYRLFDGDIYNDFSTYYKQKETEHGNIFAIYCNIKNDIYFKFDIVTTYGVDIPQRIENGKFLKLKEAPKGFQDVWILYDKLYEE